MFSTAKAARRISEAPAPALLLDTCALLDLMRDPTRENFSRGQIEASKRLLILAKSRPRLLWLPIVAQVFSERLDNQIKVGEEAASSIARFEQRLKNIQSLFAAHGLPTSTVSPSLTESGFTPTAGSLV